MFFVVRHGERADFSYDSKEKSRVFKDYDPPLTAVGLKQSLKTGDFIKNSLNKINSVNKTPIIITSPFLRCVETAINIAKNFDFIYENSIFLENSIGEYLHRTWFTYNVYDDLMIKKQQINDGYKFIDGFLDKKEMEALSLQYPEDFVVFFKRIQNAMEQISKKFFMEFDEKKYFLVIVTHGYAVQVVLKNYSALQKIQDIEYCSITLLKYRADGNYDTLISASDAHLFAKL